MTYDQWKTTPPDWMQENDEPTPEQEEAEWFDEWFGLWLSDMEADGYFESLEGQHQQINHWPRTGRG